MSAVFIRIMGYHLIFTQESPCSRTFNASDLHMEGLGWVCWRLTWRSVGGNMMEHRQGRWILCAPSVQGTLGLEPRRCRLKAWAPISVCHSSAAPARRTPAPTDAVGHTTPLWARASSAIKALKGRLTFLLFDFSVFHLSSLPSSSFLFKFPGQYTVRTSLKTTKLAFPQNYILELAISNSAQASRTPQPRSFLRHHHRSQSVTAGHCR